MGLSAYNYCSQRGCDIKQLDIISVRELGVYVMKTEFTAIDISLIEKTVSFRSNMERKTPKEHNSAINRKNQKM